jgi:hypothetical protein
MSFRLFFLSASLVMVAFPSLAQDRPFLSCPVTQPAVKNGARPDPELLKKLVRCSKGEKAAEKGYDGAVTVDVAAVQIGEASKWSPSRDSGNGKIDTMVSPTKVTYSVHTHYKTRIAAEDNSIRILNFYVNAFGEWQSGSEEPVKSAEVKSIPR